MKIGLAIPQYARWFRGEPAFRVLAKARELRLQSIWLVDHIILTPTQAVGYGTGTTDVWTASAYFAGVCNAIDYHPYFSQAIVVIPWRPPIQQAQVIASIDHFTNGRLLIGAGSGHIVEASDALGQSFDERTAMTDEYLKCMISLWKNRVASFHGAYVNFGEMTIMVRPTQEPHPPIIYGGRGPRPFRRIGEYCQGYLPGSTSPLNEPSVRYGPIGEQPSHYEGKPVFPWDAEELTGTQRLERDLREIQKYWDRYGRTGKPYVALTIQCQISDRRDEDVSEVGRGLVKEGERAFRATYPVVHVDDLVRTIRAWNDVGVDHVAIRPGAYRYGDLDQVGNLLHQLELLAEHVLPKAPIDHGPIVPFSYADSIEGVD
ncbi:MAG: LLM class flavin-dependent oxidoreductase [Chloroflexi bacterium]|nr:LLM class flavin-dependent oxidoreductase [Chloroflexota bacterium]